MLTRAYPKEVTLKDGRQMVIRPLESGDFDKLYDFFQSLADRDRLFLRHNVRDPQVVRKWTEQIDFERVIPLIGEDHGRIVADGTLHLTFHGWMQHVGHVRLVVAQTHRHQGLGTIVARELVALAEEQHLEKLQAHVIDDDIGSVKMFQMLGFEKAAVLKDLVKDQKGNERDLAIMINRVTHLGRVMEDWIQDSMIPAYRIPGGG